MQMDFLDPPVTTGAARTSRASAGEFQADLYDRIMIAEGEVAKYARHYPSKEGVLRKATRHLVMVGSGNIPEALYRAHLRELMWRAGNGQSCQRVTAAEILLDLMKSDEVSPLTTTQAALMGVLQAEVFGRSPTFVKEPYEGACRELRSQMERRLRTKRKK